MSKITKKTNSTHFNVLYPMRSQIISPDSTQKDILTFSFQKLVYDPMLIEEQSNAILVQSHEGLGLNQGSYLERT